MDVIDVPLPRVFMDCLKFDVLQTSFRRHVRDMNLPIDL